MTMVFTAFVFLEFEKLYVIRWLRDTPTLSNRWLALAVGTSMVLQLAVLYTPLNEYFGTVPLGARRLGDNRRRPGDPSASLPGHCRPAQRRRAAREPGDSTTMTPRTESVPMSTPVRRIVLDLLKPHEPNLVQVAAEVADGPSVEAVNAVLVESDRDVDTVKLTIEGDGIDVADLEDQIEDLGASVHSIDEVVCGDRMIDQSLTPQDP
ncbi:MAG: DUF211 domain-containing protein [Natrialbaceae archaeon]|nr:DUF211 domain-containing protein [Natrialbaceae archaeon]